jgi:hypothetical protein
MSLKDIELYTEVIQIKEVKPEIPVHLRRMAEPSNTKFHRERILEQARALFERSEWQIGKRVQLIKTPKIDRDTSSGWIGSKHFLVKGARATIEDVDFARGGFILALLFDDESWKDSDGIIHPRKDSEKHLYHFGEKHVELI